MEPVTDLIFYYFHGMSSFMCVCVFFLFMLQLTFTNISSICFHPHDFVSIWIGSFEAMVSWPWFWDSQCPVSDRSGYRVLQLLRPRRVSLGWWGLQPKTGLKWNLQQLVTMSWMTPSSLSQSITCIIPLNPPPHQPAEVDTSFYRLGISSTENSVTESVLAQIQLHVWLQSPRFFLTAALLCDGWTYSGPTWGFPCHKSTKIALLGKILFLKGPAFMEYSPRAGPWIGGSSNNQIFELSGIDKRVRQLCEV